MTRRLEIPNGTRFCGWEVLGEAKPYISPQRQTNRKMRCKCVCGTVSDVLLVSLRMGKSKSCGCLSNERTRERSTTHGRANHYLYHVWYTIKSRCYDERHSSYRRYGRRGIRLHDPWVSDVSQFCAYIDSALGPRPCGTSLDRINNDGDYEPGNLRWATRVEQQNNTRRNLVIDYLGESMTISYWATKLGISKFTLRARLRKGWTVEETLTIPVGGTRHAK